jgi:hypothetical protein
LCCNADSLQVRSSAASKETQEMLDFCAKHNVLSDIELIPSTRSNGLRAYAQKRCALSLRDRYEVVGVENFALAESAFGSVLWAKLLRHGS